MSFCVRIPIWGAQTENSEIFFCSLEDVLKKFNPQLTGISFGEGITGDNEAGLNVANAADEARYI